MFSETAEKGAWETLTMKNGDLSAGTCFSAELNTIKETQLLFTESQSPCNLFPSAMETDLAATDFSVQKQPTTSNKFTELCKLLVGQTAGSSKQLCLRRRTFLVFIYHCLGELIHSAVYHCPKCSLLTTEVTDIWAMKQDRKIGDYYKAHCKHIQQHHHLFKNSRAGPHS